MKEINIYPKISTTVSKLGVAIPTINLPPTVTCRPNAPCLQKCYARKGNFAYKNVKTSHMKNLESYIKSPKAYFDVINFTLFQVPYKYFRYHSSGDIVDTQYLELMCRTANKNKQTKFLCFTKKYEIVNEYIINGRKIPKNLTIVLSNWGFFVCENPHSLPTSYVEIEGVDIPKTSNECLGYCGECINTTSSCWSLKSGESVKFKLH